MKQSLIDCIQFANTCSTQHVKPRELAELIEAINKAAAAGERNCNERNYPRSKYDMAMERVEKLALEFGWETDWPGLYPSFKDRKGHSIHIPNI